GYILLWLRGHDGRHLGRDAAKRLAERQEGRGDRRHAVEQRGQRCFEPGQCAGWRRRSHHDPMMDRRERLCNRPQERSCSAFGKKSCCPSILYSPIAACPSGEISQSMKLWPASALTLGCFCGLTNMTPYWLNNRLSPSTTMSSSPRFLNDSQVARSDRT